MGPQQTSKSQRELILWLIFCSNLTHFIQYFELSYIKCPSI
jgi:hypothetical protein